VRGTSALGIVTTLLLAMFFANRAMGASPPILRGPNFDERITAIHSVAIMPIDCPGTLDCASSEREFVYFLRAKQHLRVVDSSHISQFLFEQGISAADAIGKESGPSFLKKLGVDALFVPRVLDYRRVDKYLGGGPGVELRADLELVVPGTPPLAKGNDTDGGPDMQLAGKPPLGRILIRVADAILGGQKR